MPASVGLNFDNHV